MIRICWSCAQWLILNLKNGVINWPVRHWWVLEALQLRLDPMNNWVTNQLNPSMEALTAKRIGNLNSSKVMQINYNTWNSIAHRLAVIRHWRCRWSAQKSTMWVTEQNSNKFPPLLLAWYFLSPPKMYQLVQREKGNWSGKRRDEKQSPRKMLTANSLL